MSADDFQTKYASVMESMLKSAVAETTKLFETMVDELKAEISRMKKENEDLKARCSQFETAISQTSVYTRESDSSVSGRSDVSEKRDTAVQCDLVPLRTVLVEQCLPLGHSSLQDQNLHCDYGELHYALQEHDYGSHEEEDSQMAFILVKQEAVLKQEEVESTVVSRQSLRDKPGSPWASHCRNENEGPFINSVCSTRETPLSPRQEETQVAMELPFLVTCSALQGAQNQSSEPEESLVISLAAVKDDIEEENEVSQRKSEIVTKGKPVTSEHRHQSEVEPIETERPSVVPQQCQSESETSANGKNISLRETADVGSTHEQVPQPTPLNDEEAFDQSKNGAAEVAASSQPGVATRRRRGRPPKKAKHLPVKEKLQSQSSNIPAEQGMENSPSPAGRCSSENKELPESQELKVDQGGVEILTPSTKVSPTVERPGTRPAESPKVPSVQPDKCGTSVTLQDAMLLVEAMNQSAVGSANSSPQRTAEPPQNQCAHHVGASQPVDEAQVKPQAPQPVVETHTKDAQAQIPKQQHNVSLSNTSTSKMPPSNVGTQTNVQALKKQPMITAVTTNRRGKAVPHKIIIVPRSGSSFTPHKIAGLSTSELPTVMSTVFVAQNKSLLPSSTASLSSVPHKTIYVSPSKPVVSKSPTNPTDLQSRTLLQPKITTVISRPVSAVASRKCQSQTIVPPAQQELAKTAAPAMVSSSLLISSLQDWTAPVESETAFNEVAIISSQKSDNTSDNFKSPKQTASVCAKTNSSEEICSTLSTPVGPTSMSSVEPCTSKQNVSAVVKLSRLQIPLSTTESVLVSELSKNGSSEHQSTLKDGPTEEKPSVGKARQLSETLVVSTDNSPSFNETSLNTSQMLDEPNDIHGKASLSPENCTTLVSQYVQPTTPTRVSHPVTEKSAKAIQASDLEDFQILFDHQMEETESAAIIHLTTTKSKDTSDPHVQMTKTQFLAQLSVSPVDDTPKVSPDRSSEETSTSDKKRSQKNSLMAQLRSHIRTHFQAKRAESNPEPRAEMESLTGSSPKRPRLENDHPKDSNTTIEPVPLSPTNPGADEDVTSLIKTTNDSTPVSLKTSGLCKDAIKPKRIVCVSSTISSRRSQPTGESAPVNPRRSNLGREGVGSKNKKSPSVSPRRSSSTKENATPENIENSEVQPRRTSSTKGDASSKNAKSGGSPSSGTKATAVKPKRTTSSSDSATPTRTNSPSVSLRTSGLSATPKMSIGEPTYFCRRKCTLPKDDSSTKEIKKESSSFSPQPCSATADGYTSETVSTSVKVNKLSKDGNSPRRNSESTSVKKNILSQDASTVQKNLRAVNAKKLTQAAKAKTIAKMKSSSQSKLQKGAKGKQLAESSASSKALKKCTAVWTPPRLPANRIPLVGGKKTANSPVKKEIISPRSQGQPMVFPHSVSLHPIPVRAPPVVSPLQPLSVIGRRLLKNQCGECGRVLSSSAALESHVSLHTGRRPFSCTLCGKRFADSKGLKRHGRVHRNGRIHVCQQCGKGFVYRFGLTKHLQMVHSRIKPFVCQICNKGCFTKLDVEAHIRIHTGEKPFHCNLCEKKFARRVDLNVHLRWHNGEKRHWCPYCGKGFLDFNNMKRHKYIHTGEKPHACPHCPKHFTQSGHLKKHVKNVHKIQ